MVQPCLCIEVRWGPEAAIHAALFTRLSLWISRIDWTFHLNNAKLQYFIRTICACLNKPFCLCLSVLVTGRIIHPPTECLSRPSLYLAFYRGIEFTYRVNVCRPVSNTRTPVYWSTLFACVTRDGFPATHETTSLIPSLLAFKLILIPHISIQSAVSSSPLSSCIFDL